MQFLTRIGTLLLVSGTLAACQAATVGGSVPTVGEATAVPDSKTATRTDSAPDPTDTQSPIPPTSTAEPSATLTPTPSRVGPEDFPEEVNPLTGLKVRDPELLDRRPVMVKVSNYPASLRPHSGLSFADWVFEYFIGEGMTRFLALFYGQDAPQAGPVRSGRLIDPQLTRLYGGILGMVRADPYVWSVIREGLPGRVVSERPSTCPALCRTGGGDVNSVFADTAAFSQYVRGQGIDNQPPDLTGMLFDSQPPQGGELATDLWIFIAYLDQVGWSYNAQGGKYLRSQEKLQESGDVELVPMTDRLTGEQLAFDNVVVLYAWHEVLQPELIDIDIWYAEGARALILRDGKLYEVTYTAESTDSPLRFYDSQGSPFPFKPGQTWVHVVGMGSRLEDLGEGSWKVRFYP